MEVTLVEIPTRGERQKAEADLAYIRDTMETASAFTAVSGWGLVTAGMIGLLATWISWAAGPPTNLRIWIPTGVLAFAAVAGATSLKARRLHVPMLSGTARKMAWGMMPALVAGGMLTFALRDHSARDLIPSMWLALYGAGVTASGAFSIPQIRWIGLTTLAFGGLAMLRPEWDLALLGMGFGITHLVFGFHIAFRHGG